MANQISTKEIETFLEGTDPQKYIVAIEATYNTPTVTLIVNDPESGKRLENHSFKPFLWFKSEVTNMIYGGKRPKIVDAAKRYGVKITSLRTHNDEGVIPPRMDFGYKFLATSKNSYNDLVNFFKEGGVDVFNKDFSSLFVMFSPAEQFLIQTGKRLFKGLDSYDDVHRFQFDLETDGLNASKQRIFQIGMRDNRGFEEIIETVGETEKQKRDSERENIKTFFKVIDILQPDIITGYNSEFFDWEFFEKRCNILGIPMAQIAITLSKNHKIKRKDGMIKLGGVSEPYKQTNMYGYNIIDIAHSVRRAQAINSDIQKWSLKYITQYSEIAKVNRVYVPGDKLSLIWGDTKNQYAFNNKNGDWYVITETKKLKNDYEIVAGNFIVRRYLLDDLWETEMVDGIFNQATFLVAKILPTTYQRSSTMGTAGQWKLIMAAWSYQNKLAIPSNTSKRDFTGGLSRLLELGYARNVAKFDYAALYPKTDITHDIFPDLDITGVMAGLLTYVVDKRDEFKFLTTTHKNIVLALKKELAENKSTYTAEQIKDLETNIELNKALQNKFDKKQLPLKILANSWFGSYGAPNIFNWGDTDAAEETTCRGRQYLRLMVRFFVVKYGFKALVLDTDGCNFSFPDNITEVKYQCKGTHWKTTKDAGKELIGLDAVLAEFNEEYMTGRMGLDIDDICNSTINFSRKNYANDINGKVKLVGNSIKSKKMPTYIEEFLQKGIKMLLAGRGKDFIEFYYEYVNKIYNYNIPLVKIASKGKVNTSMAEYKKKATLKNKAGNPMPKQAHMELALRVDLNISHGDIIYYVNTGKVKSHGDLKSTKDKESGRVTVELNCKMLDSVVVEQDYELIKELELLKKLIANDDLKLEELEEAKDRIIEIDDNLATDEYNVSRYLAAFNKKVKPLLVCFEPDIRNDILIEIKKDKVDKVDKLQERSVFTELQCQLCSGKANKPADQDTYEDLMTMEDKEIRFWDRVNKIPNNLEEDEWIVIRDNYKARLVQDKIDGIISEQERMEDVIKHLETNDIEAVHKEGILPIDIFKFSDIDKDGEPYLVSRKWNERLCHIQELFKYEDAAIERNKFYIDEGIVDNINKYDQYFDWKREQIIMTGETLSNDVTVIESFDDISEKIKLKAQTITNILPTVILENINQLDEEEEEEEEEIITEETSVFEDEDDFALDLQHNSYVDDVPTYSISRPNIKVYPVHVPIVKAVLEPVMVEVIEETDEETDDWNF